MMLVLLLLLFSPIVSAYTDESINLLVRSSPTSQARRYCIELAKLPNNRVVNVTAFGWYQPYLASPSVNACNASDLQNSLPSSFSADTMLVISEHDCKMTEHAWNVQQQFGEGIRLMILTNRTDTRYSLTLNSTTMPVTIPTLIFWTKDFNRLKNAYQNLSNVELSIDFPPIIARRFRPATLLMFLLVLVVLLCGNFWAADEFRRRIKEMHAHKSSLSVISNSIPVTDSTDSSQIIAKQNAVAPTTSAEDHDPAVIPMTYCIIVFILCFAVGWLLLIYYFPKVMIYILQVMFCIGAFSSLTSCLNRLSEFIPPLRHYRIPARNVRKPCTCQLGPINMATVFALALSLTLVLVWYFYRHADWAWVLQDILGAAICISVTSIYRLGNMRVITLILLGFFLYDIFFVFITPYIPLFQTSSTPSNPTNTSGTTTIAPSGSLTPVSQSISRKPSKTPSVMEQVALGFGTNGEVVPLLFALPMFISESELDPCASIRNSMLGFGDVILPGILLTFCKLFDIASANRWPVYYIQSLISYFVGLALTHVALNLMDTAQPALLYLVPCLLISTVLTGLYRRELKELYTGKRIQSLLDGKPQNSPASLLHGIDNPIGQQSHDEGHLGDAVIAVKPLPGDDNQ